MRLTGEEARRWIANNPNVAYTNNRTGQRIERQKSGIENFALGMSAPFRKGAGVAEEFGLTIKDILGYAGGGQYVDPSTRARKS